MVLIEGLDHVQVAAPPHCEEAARRFFGELLGLIEVEKPPSLRSRGGVWFQAGGQQLHVGVEGSFAPARKAHPAFRVRPGALEELAARLQAAGAKVLWDEGLGDLRRFYSEDPWGNRIEVGDQPRGPFSITTARLRLRPLTAEDLAALSAVYLHPLVMRWIGPQTPEDVVSEIEQQIDHQRSLGWSLRGVEERDGGTLIGDCGLQPLERRGPEVDLGYDFHPRAWGSSPGTSRRSACSRRLDSIGRARARRTAIRW